MVSLMSKLVPSPIRKLGFHIGRRGTFLLFWADLWLLSGYRWIVKPPPPDNYQLMLRMAPPAQWGILFLAIAVVTAAGAFWKFVDPLSFSLAYWVASFLGIITAVGAFRLSGPAAFAAGTVAFTYFSYALLVYVTSGWPEASSKKEPRENGD